MPSRPLSSAAAAYSGEVGHPFRWEVGRVRWSQPQG